MTTSQVVWTVVIVVAALLLIGLIAASMRKKSLADNRAQAGELRAQADTRAAVLTDAQARADQAEAQAERARLEAQRAEEHSAAVHAEVDQERALHEDRIRAADRLDPDVDHRAEDYSPEVVDPAGPSDIPADPAYADPGTGRASADTTTPEAPAAGSTVTLEPTDTSPRDETAGSDRLSLRDRLDGDAPDRSDQQVDRHPDETAGGSHRA